MEKIRYRSFFIFIFKTVYTDEESRPVGQSTAQLAALD
jgi:hypothetical protein